MNLYVSYMLILADVTGIIPQILKWLNWTELTNNWTSHWLFITINWITFRTKPTYIFTNLTDVTTMYCVTSIRLWLVISFIIVNIIRKGVFGTNVNRPGLPNVLGHIKLYYILLPSDLKTFIQARMYYMFRNKLLLLLLFTLATTYPCF